MLNDIDIFSYSSLQRSIRSALPRRHLRCQPANLHSYSDTRCDLVLCGGAVWVVSWVACAGSDSIAALRVASKPMVLQSITMMETFVLALIESGTVVVQE